MEPNRTSYQPFLIGQGVSRTGFFSYLESWVKPEDAFDELINAYVYRGSIYQRQGISLFPSASAAGALVYKNNQIISIGNAGNSYAYNSGSGSALSNFPLISASITVTATTSSGNETWTDSGGTGTLTGSLGDTGTINYTLGQWTLTLSGGRTIANNIPIVAQYNYVPTNAGVNNPIMGIYLHQDANSNTQRLFVVDTKRASWWNPSPKSFVPIQGFQQIMWSSNSDVTVITTGAITLQWTNLAPYSVTITDGFNTINDIPTNSTTGTFTSSGNLNPAGSSINYTTGVVTLTLTAGAANSTTLYKITGSLQSDYFNGNNSNFFNFFNWQTVENQPSYLYMTNNVDFVTLFDGINLARPPFAINSAHTINDNNTGQVLYPNANDFGTCIDVKVYKNRLLFIRPTLLGDTPDGQSIRWSQLGNVTFPLGNFNFVANVVGNGGELSAPTGDWLQCAQFLRDALIVFFQNSTWLFRFTGNTNDLFRFDKTNGSRSTSAPYGSVEYDDVVTSMGAKGLISCDGVSVLRYDESVIDLIEDINQEEFNQCYALKYDTYNHTWMLFPSSNLDLTTSDSVIIYNYLEKTWAIFVPNLGALAQSPDSLNTLSCLGLGSMVGDLTWDDFAVGSQYFSGQGQTWSQATYAWNSFALQELAPALLGGDQNGFVYTMLQGATDNPGPLGSDQNGIPTIIKTKRFNPFIQNGVKARFGYLDVYYEINENIQVTLNFYLNNSNEAAFSKLFTFNGPTNSVTAWKRIYLSVVGEFLQIEINSQIGVDQDTNDPIYNTGGAFKILGMILWASPSGRLTPGLFL